MTKKYSFMLLILIFTISGAGSYEGRVIRSQDTVFRLQKVSGELNRPWGMAFVPGGILITERPGRLKLLTGGRLYQVSGLPHISSGGQGGLLDIAVSPQFSRDKMVFFTYSKAGARGRGTALASGKLEGTSLRNIRVLWEMKKRSGSSIHFGSRIRFLPDGSLIFTTGDRGSSGRAQKLSDSAGKVHRLKRDGSIPSDNPFFRVKAAVKSVYSFGHRNPQGLAISPDNKIWISEHGPQGGDEINIIKRGANYGWPVITYGRNYVTGTKIGEGTSKPGMEQPVTYWSPSIAPSGLEFYSGRLIPAWKGNLFSGALAGRHLVRMQISGVKIISQEILLKNAVGRIRDVKEGPDGYLYILTDERKGALYRIGPQ